MAHVRALFRISSSAGALCFSVVSGCALILNLDEPLPRTRAVEGADVSTSGDGGPQPAFVDADTVDGNIDATSCDGWTFCDTFTGDLQPGWLLDTHAVYSPTFGNPAGSLSLTSPALASRIYGPGSTIKVEFDIFFGPLADGIFFEFSALTGCDAWLSKGSTGTIAFIQGRGTTPIPLSENTWHHIAVTFRGSPDGVSTLKAYFDSIDVEVRSTCGAPFGQRLLRFAARTGGQVWFDNVRIGD